MKILPYTDKFKPKLISVWELSVRATHDFLMETDIQDYKSILSNIDLNAFAVYLAVIEGEIVGFIGIADRYIEMLFVTPTCIGQGVGKALVGFAIDQHQANKVDVNEQNTAALGFYQKLGFVIDRRMEKDNAGKPYPILKMKLSSIS